MELALICALIMLVILLALSILMRHRYNDRSRAIIEMMNKDYDQMMYAHIEEISCLRREHAEKIRLVEDSCAAKIDEVEKRATVFQDRLAVILRDQFGQNYYKQDISRDLRLILRVVEQQRHVYFAAMTKPHLEFDKNDPCSVKSCFDQRRIELIRFAVSIGLSEDTSPELVAQQIAENVKRAVLQNWQHQSALLLGEKA